MRVRKSTKVKFKWLSRIKHHMTGVVYLSHFYFYKPSGEALPGKNERRLWKKILFCFCCLLPIFYLASRMLEVFFRIHIAPVNGPIDLLQLPPVSMLFHWDFSGWLNPLVSKVPLAVRGVLLLVCLFPAVLSGFKIDMWTRPISDGQKGDNRLTTIEEIQKIFIEIPEKNIGFPGYGGIPITHYKDLWYIETDTVNTCGVGTSRSGKGQDAVLPLIENLSRAQKQSALVVNDPKQELYLASHDELEERGYEVLAYNIGDALQSMSDNPFNLIVKYWKRGDIDNATELTNTFTNTIYSDPNAGDNKYFNDNAQKAVNALIFALLEQADFTTDYSKVTPNNIVELLSEIGGFNYPDPENELLQINALDDFMSKLPPGNLAKKQYGATKLGSEKAKGNILSTAITGLNPYTLPKIAKMSSLSTLDYKSVGFPKYIDLKVHESLLNKRLTVNFLRGEKVIHQERIKVGFQGFCELNFDCDLQSGDIVEIVYKYKEKEYKARYRFSRRIEKDEKGRTVYQKKRGCEHLPEYKKAAVLTLDPATNNLAIESIYMHYSEKPIAIFMLTPDYNTSNHVIVSIFLKQLYTELSAQCIKTKGDKCHRRVHFILDEFGNMPAIDDMANVLTVTAGRNMLWDLFVQSYAQIFAKYGEKDGTTIKENCQIHIFIASLNDDTIEEFSKKVGNKTVEQEMTTIDQFGRNVQAQRSVDNDRILTYERVSTLLEGETIVLRTLKRRDKDRLKVRPFPIFNTEETNIPYAHEYLDRFDPSGKDMSEVDIHCKHADLDLSTLKLDYDYFLVTDYAKRMYQQQLDAYEEMARSREEFIEGEGQESFSGFLEKLPPSEFKESMKRRVAIGTPEKIYEKLVDQENPELSLIKKRLLQLYKDEQAKNASELA
ncbi:VirD4-like conjugal transfer protein, CD1115 family [Enterococcus gilvus]|uniref:VirD4-like conjugal transfer protein, CD1115 family n=1 Tax=Enterococcus gilvus TaxID=160453 RepID=UPI0028D359D3|nr:type IV secretory system conjugative DNA transfer family protein [Enterococcus gilvus]